MLCLRERNIIGKTQSCLESPRMRLNTQSWTKTSSVSHHFSNIFILCSLSLLTTSITPASSCRAKGQSCTSGWLKEKLHHFIPAQILKPVDRRRRAVLTITDRQCEPVAIPSNIISQPQKARWSLYGIIRCYESQRLATIYSFKHFDASPIYSPCYQVLVIRTSENHPT